MKAISVLGTASNSGKSWVSTALCAWFRRRGVRVAPFKAQNMSNNSAATLKAARSDAPRPPRPKHAACARWRR